MDQITWPVDGTGEETDRTSSGFKAALSKVDLNHSERNKS